MLVDWRRQILQLPSVGDLSAQAVRAAYWRLKSAGVEIDRDRLRDAKRQLLFELGARPPTPPKSAAREAPGAPER